MLLLSAEEEIKILRVIDGDTVSAESRGTEIKIRLSEIDAPEMGQPFGTNSKKCLSELKKLSRNLSNKIPNLPFSNVWVAFKISKKVPMNSVIHFGILHSLRSWNLFEIPHSVLSDSNVIFYLSTLF